MSSENCSLVRSRDKCDMTDERGGTIGRETKVDEKISISLACVLSLVGILTIPVINDSKQIRVSSIPSGIVGQAVIFTSK